MLSPEIYRDAYGFEAIEVMSGYPPLIRIEQRFARPILANAPYLTHSLFPTTGCDWSAYLERCRALAGGARAAYLLIKTDQEEAATTLPEGFEVDLSHGKCLLDISGGRDFVWKRVIPGKTRNQIRKGEALGARTAVGREELLDDFYRVTVCTQTDLGTPVQSRGYFAAILRHQPTARLVVLYLGLRPVSAALVVTLGQSIFHPYAGTLGALKPTSVNNVLYWRIIELGISWQCTTFDMGRSRRGSGNERYKLGWGGRDRQLYYLYWLPTGGRRPDLDSRLVHLATSAWRYLPKPIASVLGPQLIRLVP